MLISFFCSQTMVAQERAGKNILTLSKVEEPVTLQKGRIQGNLRYIFDYYTKYYNSNGQKSDLIDHGLVSSMNQLNCYLSYGLTDKLQVEVQNGYYSGYEGYETVMKLFYEKYYNYTSTTEIGGLSDMLVNLGYKLSGKMQKAEIAIFPGIYIPMSHDPKEPEYNISSISDGDPKDIHVDYTSYERVGTGAFRFNLASKTKFRFTNKMALQIFGQYNFPLASVRSVYWESIYDGEKYASIKHDCSYSPSHELIGNVEYQLIPDKKEIMGLSFGMNMKVKYNEWINKEENKKYLPNTYLSSIYTELELILSKNIRFHQKFWFDNAGKNTKGAIGTQTSFTLNLLAK